MPIASPPFSFSTLRNCSAITSKASSQLTGVKSPSFA